jgi:ribosomal protein S18 acetylase RimI-like enzyme
VRDGLRSGGVGSAVLAAGVRRSHAAGAKAVWANARDSALGFYRRAGFAVEGEGFVSAATGLAHHVVTLPFW